MAERTFIFKEASAQALEDAFTKMASNLREEMDEMNTRVDSEVSGWGSDTDSRQAQKQKGEQLTERAEDLAEVLDKAATAMGKIRSLAHEAEVSNVAVLD
jgi:hypothetical protein